MTDYRKAALFVDAENVSFKNAKPTLESQIVLSNVTVRRIYGDFEFHNFHDWVAWGISNNCIPVGVPHQNRRKQKNAADIAMAVDAMQLLLGNNPPDALILFTSDIDFVPIITKYKERGVPVYVFGNPDVSTTLIRAVDEYTIVHKAKTVASPELHKQAELLIDAAIDCLKDKYGVAYVSQIGNEIRAMEPNFKQTWLRGKLITFLKGKPHKYNIAHIEGKGLSALVVNVKEKS